MTSSAPGSATTLPPALARTGVFRVYIRATPEAIWQAVTDPEWTVRYGYGAYVHYDLRPGGALRVEPDDVMRAGAAAAGYPCPDVLIDGEVLEVDAPRLLRTTWRMLMDPTTTAEGFTTITYEIRPVPGPDGEPGYCSLTVTHECENAPVTLQLVSGAGDAAPDQGGGGHPWILSDLKSLLETGRRMAG